MLNALLKKVSSQSICYNFGSSSRAVLSSRKVVPLLRSFSVNLPSMSVGYKKSNAEYVVVVVV